MRFRFVRIIDWFNKGVEIDMENVIFFGADDEFIYWMSNEDETKIWKGNQ